MSQFTKLRTFLGVNPWTINKKKTCRRRQKESGTTRIRNKVRRHKSWKSQREHVSFVPSGSPWWGSFSRWWHCSTGFFSFSLRRFLKGPHPTSLGIIIVVVVLFLVFRVTAVTGGADAGRRVIPHIILTQKFTII